MMFVMAFVVTADKVIHVVGNVEVGKIVLVQFLLVMNCRSATDDLATKKQIALSLSITALRVSCQSLVL